MGKRGPRSAASFEIAISPLDRVERQRPPAELTDEQVEIWVGIVNAMPAEWFSTCNAPLLAQFCRHVIEARKLGELIDKATGNPETEIGYFDRLLKMQERESSAIASLATKMRITQQATINKRGNAVRNRPAPWE